MYPLLPHDLSIVGFIYLFPFSSKVNINYRTIEKYHLKILLFDKFYNLHLTRYGSLLKSPESYPVYINSTATIPAIISLA